jgi:hypothetical protein
MGSETPSVAEIDRFIREQYRLWSADAVDDMLELFRNVAPRGYTIQYVGHPAEEGNAAMATMISQYRGKVRTHLRQLIVNGAEAAAVVDNEFVETATTVPSIETYRFEGGRMEIRYYHEAPPE